MKSGYRARRRRIVKVHLVEIFVRHLLELLLPIRVRGVVVIAEVIQTPIANCIAIFFIISLLSKFFS